MSTTMEKPDRLADDSSLFMGLPIARAAGVFAPRAETELLARTVLDLLADAGPARVIDMCCGSGNLTCAVAVRRDHVRVLAVDLLPEAVEATRRNAERFGVASRVEARQGDLFEDLEAQLVEGGVDLVMANPPYIPTSTLLNQRAHLLEHEPRAAFDGGPYGIDILRRLVRGSVRALRPGAPLVFEVGAGQDAVATWLLARSGGFEAPAYMRDREGTVRVLVARRQG